jgi:hypothetical protein
MARNYCEHFKSEQSGSLSKSLITVQTTRKGSSSLTQANAKFILEQAMKAQHGC